MTVYSAQPAHRIASAASRKFDIACAVWSLDTISSKNLQKRASLARVAARPATGAGQTQTMLSTTPSIFS